MDFRPPDGSNEILAQQHLQSLQPWAEAMGTIALLTGSVKTSERKPIHEDLASGKLQVLVGTHALLEEKVNSNIWHLRS